MSTVSDALNWWEKTGDELGSCLYSVFTRLWTQQETRREEFRTYACLYGDADMTGVSPWQYARAQMVNEGSRVSSNVVASIVDTLVANVTQVQIRPQVQTFGASWDKRQRAETLQKASDGLIYATNAHQLMPLIWRDACIFGTGIMRVFERLDHRGRMTPAVERVLPNEILIDDADGFYGRPRVMMRVRGVDRNVLKARFPKKKKEIDLAERVKDEEMYLSPLDVLADMVAVVESWHMESGFEAGDGMYVVSTGNEVLHKEAWTAEHFPFVVIREQDALAGWWGMGEARALMGKQYEINRWLLDIQESTHSFATPRVGMSNGAQVIDTEMNDEIGSIIHSSGDMPQALVWPAYSQDVYAHGRWLRQSCYEDRGISQMDAQATKPAGLNSGIAQRTYADITTKRQVDATRRYEAAHIDLYYRLIDSARRCDAAAKDGGFSVIWKGDRQLEKVKWSDADMEPDEFEVQVFPASALPQEPAARLQTVQELAAQGWINRSTGKRLLGWPDIEREQLIDAAPYDLVCERINRIIVKGEYLAPEEFMDLNLCINLGGKMYQRAVLDDVPEDRLMLVRRFIDDASTLLDRATPPPSPAAAPTMGPPGPMPPGPPGLGPPVGPLPPGLPPPIPQGAPPGIVPMGPPAAA